MDERYIAAIDLGTSKIALTVAKVEGADVQVIYYKEVPSDGIRYSYVFNPLKVAGPLREIVRDAESELGIKILQVVVGLPKYFVRQETASKTIPRTDGGKSITEEEVEGLKNMALDDYPLDDAEKETIYGAVAQSFSTDDFCQLTDEDVIGMISDKLEGNFKVFVGSKKNVCNIDKLFNDTGIAIARKYFVPEVLAKIVLTKEEMDNGVALVDLGGGVTSVSVYRNGILRHYSAIPFGGYSITNDIKLEGSFSIPLAENIKLAYGSCLPDKLASLSEKIIRVRYPDSGSEKEISVKYLSEIITCRSKEIIDAILFEIQSSGFADELRSGIVITGGGAELPNINNLIKDLSGYNVRTGYPLHKFSYSGCTGTGETSSASVIGILMAAKEDRYINCVEAAPSKVNEEETDDILILKNPENVEDSEAKEDKPARQSPPKKTTRGVWHVFTKVKNTVEDNMTSLFEDMANED